MIGGRVKRLCSSCDAERFKSDTSGKVPRVLQSPIGAANEVTGTLRLKL